MLQTTLRGGVAGAVATVVMTLEQPLDKRLFNSNYDDVEILGKLFTRGDHWATHRDHAPRAERRDLRRRLRAAQAIPAGAGSPPWPAGGPHRARRGMAVDRRV